MPRQDESEALGRWGLSTGRRREEQEEEKGEVRRQNLGLELHREPVQVVLSVEVGRAGTLHEQLILEEEVEIVDTRAHPARAGEQEEAEASHPRRTPAVSRTHTGGLGACRGWVRRVGEVPPGPSGSGWSTRAASVVRGRRVKSRITSARFEKGSLSSGRIISIGKITSGLSSVESGTRIRTETVTHQELTRVY